MTTPAIIVHGGARPVAPEKADANRAGCARAASAGWAVLREGGSSADAVETAIRVLESDPTFNAGYGATLNPDGVARLDAGMMEGAELRAGAVACVTGVRHPISAARRLMERAEVLIVGEHAERFALSVPEAESCAPESLISETASHKWREQQESKSDRAARSGCDTVGCVALDSYGVFAAGASTGGIGEMLPGRVGDSPQVGSGFYSDNDLGGSAMTGFGEEIMRVNLAYRALTNRTPDQGADDALASALRHMKARTGGVGGGIVIDAAGRIGWNHSDENIAVAYQTGDMEAPAAFVHKDEERKGASIT